MAPSYSGGGPSDYFRAKESAPLKQKEVEKPLYKCVTGNSAYDLVNNVNDFLAKNTEYEISGDDIRFSSGINTTLFKLKEVKKSNKKTTVKD